MPSSDKFARSLVVVSHPHLFDPQSPAALEILESQMKILLTIAQDGSPRQPTIKTQTIAYQLMDTPTGTDL